MKLRKGGIEYCITHAAQPTVSLDIKSTFFALLLCPTNHSWLSYIHHWDWGHLELHARIELRSSTPISICKICLFISFCYLNMNIDIPPDKLHTLVPYIVYGFPTFISYLKIVFIFSITSPPNYENVRRVFENHILFQIQEIFLLGDLYYLKARVHPYTKK